MSSIKVETIGKSYYAPEGAEKIQLYAFNEARDLTLGELVMAICFRKCESVERQAVVTMNKINETAVWLETLSVLLEDIVKRRTLTTTFNTKKTGYTPVKLGDKPCTYQNFLIYEVGLTCPVPDQLASLDEQLKMAARLEDPINQATTNNQEQMVELQSILSRRDSTFNTSAATVKKLGSTMSAIAANF